jgi:hypothetical protein
MGETATAIRGELGALNAVVTQLVAMNLDSEVKALGSKLDVVQLNVGDVATIVNPITVKRGELAIHTTLFHPMKPPQAEVCDRCLLRRVSNGKGAGLDRGQRKWRSSVIDNDLHIHLGRTTSWAFEMLFMMRISLHRQ